MLRRNTLCRARSRKIPSIAKGVGNKLVGVTSTTTHVFTGRDTGRPLQIAAMSSPVMPDIWPKMSSTTNHRQLVVQVAWDGTGASPFARLLSTVLGLAWPSLLACYPGC